MGPISIFTALICITMQSLYFAVSLTRISLSIFYSAQFREDDVIHRLMRRRRLALSYTVLINT